MQKSLKKILMLIVPLLVLQLHLFGQSKDLLKIEGSVMDENGKELVGVSIRIKEKSGSGTTSNNNGYFTLGNISKGNTVIFSLVGYKDYQLEVNESMLKLKIALTEETNEMDEVVVVGRGEQRKITVTGAVTSIDVKELQVPASSISNMLGGRVPGIIAVTRSGEPGSDFSEFWVRGISTFGANQSALILIDGVEGDLNNVDPSDLESFTVLKDASATAVYGVRGANGVVLITTKRGKAGALKMSFRANSTITQSARMPEYVESYDYARLANEARQVRGLDPIYSEVELEIFKKNLDPDLYPNVDWRDVLLKDFSRYDQGNLNISGGGTNARYYMSLGYLNKEGIFKQDKAANKYDVNTNYYKYNFRANIDVDLTPTTQLALNLDDAITQTNSPAYATDNKYLWTSQANITPVSVPLRYSTGQLAGYGANGTELTPYYLLNYTGFSKTNTNTVNVKLNLQQDLKSVTPGLTGSALFSYMYKSTHTASHTKLGADVYHATGRANDGSLISTRTVSATNPTYGQGSQADRQVYMEGRLNYAKLIDDKHNFTGLLHYYRQEDVTSDVDKYESSYMSIVPLRFQALSGRIAYSYKDTYLADLNMGYSGSENFKPGEQYGLFPAISAGWVPTQYEWVDDHVPFIDFFKIRGSWGKVGNAQILDDNDKLVRFPFQTILTTSSNDWGSTITEDKVGTDGLRWQTSTKYDVGVDAKFYKNRFDLTVDAFLTDAKDIYQQRVTIPEEVGAAQSPYLNVGSMRSWGMDGTLAYTQTLNPDFTFTLRGNFTFSRNKVTHWEQTGVNFPYQSYTDVPYGVQRGLIALGLFKDEDDIVSSPKQTFMANYLPGDIKYKDVNGDGIIDTDDVVPLDYSDVPRIVYGFAASVNWKKWNFNVFFTGQNQVSYFLGGSGYYPFAAEETGNLLSIVTDQSNRWIPASVSGDASTENPNARFPRLTYGANSNNNRASTFWMADASFLRLKNLEIGYRFEGVRLAKKKIAAINLNLIGDNLAIWDSVKLWDPEQASDNGSVYPLQRTYTLQMNITF
ncbi:SusC/RagA family TonB-linked outer membrane protein [Sphingobacterium sp. LRF_L2]|uniref:SusC/RagA family TonB-linked outer membrane protein n=1 Tax=Sphingobacterium sp. LRF_L2 TaxID=3369421 RepID=UPI003F60E41E